MANKAEKIASLIEKHLCKDLNFPLPLSYQILPPQGEGLPPQSFLINKLNGRAQVEITRGWHQQQGITPLCYVYFNLTQPRPFELQVLIYNPGMDIIIHRLAYAVPLTKSAGGQVCMTDSEATVFSGEPETAARLNSNPHLLKLAATLAITQRRESGVTLSIERYLHIYPSSTGSLLVLHTLPQTLMTRQTLLGGEVLQLAFLIDAVL